MKQALKLSIHRWHNRCAIHGSMFGVGGGFRGSSGASYRYREGDDDEGYCLKSLRWKIDVGFMRDKNRLAEIALEVQILSTVKLPEGKKNISKRFFIATNVGGSA
jgi:hypothetical protein